jgi:hypothetical protein
MTINYRQIERRRVPRIAFQVHAALREPGNQRFPIRVIDISTHGCRIELSCAQELASNVWLYLNNLDAQSMRVAWNRDTFAGLEFDTPLHEAVLDALLDAEQDVAEPTTAELYGLALRSQDGADRAAPAPVAYELKSLARACASAALERLLNHKVVDDAASGWGVRSAR